MKHNIDLVRLDSHSQNAPLLPKIAAPTCPHHVDELAGTGDVVRGGKTPKTNTELDANLRAQLPTH